MNQELIRKISSKTRIFMLISMLFWMLYFVLLLYCHLCINFQKKHDSLFSESKLVSCWVFPLLTSRKQQPGTRLYVCDTQARTSKNVKARAIFASSVSMKVDRFLKASFETNNSQLTLFHWSLRFSVLWVYKFLWLLPANEFKRGGINKSF